MSNKRQPTTPTAAQTRRANRGNIPGHLGMEELAKLAPARTPGLPSRWHDVRDPVTGTVLYWRREHTGYEVHPDADKFRVELDGRTISGLHETMTHAIVAARDHMHASSNKVTTGD